MRLKNKKTGEIIELSVKCENGGELRTFDLNTNTDKPITLAELNEGWTDAPEEPKEYWYIDTAMMEVTYNTLGAEPDLENFNKEIGNHFSSKEEAEKAVERLRAWERLKDKGFRFENGSLDICCHTIHFKVDRQFDMTDETSRDLHLLFRGEE